MARLFAIVHADGSVQLVADEKRARVASGGKLQVYSLTPDEDRPHPSGPVEPEPVAKPERKRGG